MQNWHHILLETMMFIEILIFLASGFCFFQKMPWIIKLKAFSRQIFLISEKKIPELDGQKKIQGIPWVQYERKYLDTLYKANNPCIFKKWGFHRTLESVIKGIFPKAANFSVILWRIRCSDWQRYSFCDQHKKTPPGLQEILKILPARKGAVLS